MDRSGRDIYVFVDESKGASQGRPESIVRFFARTFERTEHRHFRYLLENLNREKAQHWHASDSGKMALHKSTLIRQILKNLSRCESRLFGFVRQEHQILSVDLLEQVNRIPRDVFEDQEELWPQDNTHATLLLWTVFSSLSLLRWRRQPIPRPKRITFFTDRMPWVTDSMASRHQAIGAPGLYLALGPLDFNGIEITVCGAISQEEAPSWIGSLLGLIDSECWIDARMGKAKVEGELSVDDQGVQFSLLEGEAAECFQIDASVVPRALEGDSTLRSNTGKLARRLSLYYQYWKKWIGEDRIVFNGVFPSTVIGGATPKRHPWEVKLSAGMGLGTGVPAERS